VKTIGVGHRPFGVAISPNGRYSYVTNSDSHSVSVIKTSTNTAVKVLGVGHIPMGVAISPNGNTAYVANYGSGTVSVIDTSTNTVVNTVTPRGIAGGGGSSGVLRPRFVGQIP
jgi:YVTN family beta-propeller protein